MPNRSELDSIIQHTQKKFAEQKTILSFFEYFDLLQNVPAQHTRSSSQYILDMMHAYEQETVNLPYTTTQRFKLFDLSFQHHAFKIAGQELVQQELYRVLSHFAREGKSNKLILLHGPNGSAKSSICRALMLGLENYAQTSEGTMYSFNWIFPSEKFSSNTHIGFSQKNERKQTPTNSYAYLDAEVIDARIPCEMHDHPIFLIPQEQRTQLLEQLFNQHAEQFEYPLSDYIKTGSLCYKCKKIYDALFTNYEGDLSQVLKHIQIERYYLSQRYRQGIATIEPQMHVDARMQQLTADRSLASLPKSLQQLALYEASGPLVDANRGLLEYSDILKRPVESFKYLLSTIETSNVSMDSFVLNLDMLYIASTNDTYLDAFKEHPDFSSFKGRMELIKVPYLLRYSSECDIYTQSITPATVGKHIAPHAIQVASLWAILTRMRKNDATLYPKDMQEVIANLTPLEKLYLYDTGTTPEYLTAREAQELQQLIPKIYEEASQYPNYEGRFGASAREIKTALLNAAHDPQYKCLNPQAVFQEIQEILNAKSVYDFLRQEVIGKYHHHRDFLHQTETLYLDWIDEEVRSAMGLASSESHGELFSKYITHISHWVKHEKMMDPISKQLKDPDAHFMQDIEKVLMSAGETKDDFRKSIIGTIGAKALDNPEQTPNYPDIFKHYVQKLKDDFYASRKKVLRKVQENFLKYTSQERDTLDAKDLEQCKQMLERMRQNSGYCEHCAYDTVAYLLKKRYASDV